MKLRFTDYTNKVCLLTEVNETSRHIQSHFLHKFMRKKKIYTILINTNLDNQFQVFQQLLEAGNIISMILLS